MREIKVLYGGENDWGSVTEALNDVLADHDIKIVSYDCRSTKEGFVNYANENDPVDVVIVSEYIDNIERIVPKDAERVYKALGADSVVIVVVSENKGSSLMRDYLNCGLYNVLFNDDGNEVGISNRIVHPYDRGKAETYYGVADTDDTAKTIVGNGRNPNSVTGFLSGARGDEKELNSRLVKLKSELKGQDFYKHLATLPIEMLEQIKKLDAFQKDAELAIDSRQKAKEKKSGAKETDSRPQENGGSLQQKVVIHKIGFVGVQHGVGCTYSAILCAFSLKAQNKKVALVEMQSAPDSEEIRTGHFRKLGETSKVLNAADSIFRLDGVDFIFDTKYSVIKNTYLARYDYVIFDFGVRTQPEELKKVTSLMDRMFIVASGADYRTGEISEVAALVNGMDKRRSFTFLFPMADPDYLGQAEMLLGDVCFTEVDCEGNMYRPSQKTADMFISRINGNAIEKKKGVIKNVDDRLQEKGKKAPVGKLNVFVTAGMAALVLIAVGIAVYLGVKRNQAVQAVYNACDYYESVVAGKDEEIAKANDKCDALDTTVFELIRPVAVGTEIAEDMLIEVTVKSDSPAGTYATKNELVGHVAAYNIEDGKPLYKHCVAEGGVEPLPSVLVVKEVAEEKMTAPAPETTKVEDETEESGESEGAEEDGEYVEEAFEE